MRFLKKLKKIALCMASLCLCAYLFNLDSNQASTYAEDWVAEIVSEANAALSEIVNDNPVLGAVYLCDSFEIKDIPSGDGNVIATIYSGQSVYILEEAVDSDFNLWAKISFTSRGTELTGYILKDYVATSDSRFLEWEQEYGMMSEYWDFSVSVFSMDGNEGGEGKVGALEAGADPEEGLGQDAENGAVNPYSDEIMAFPESYREALQTLKEAHPNWIFVKQTVGLDFQTAVNEELKGKKSLVNKSFETGAKEWTYDNGNWYYASEEILAFYMDPRNALTEARIFQFEQLTYNADYHTLASVETFLNGTFMSGTNSDGSVRYAPGLTITYADLIYSLAKEEKDGVKVRNISPYLIASRIIQEQGVNGNSALISGTYPGYEGYYNFFNIGATGNSNADYITNGLNYAKNNWGPGSTHDPFVALYGQDGYSYYGVYASLWYGADFLTNGYISKGQDTLYLQKYNVAPDAYYATYTHQYMQNVSAPTSEGSNTKAMYEKSGVLDGSFVFKIPVYENMPETPCARPYTTTKLYIKLPEGYSSYGISSTPSVWIDGVEHNSVTRNGYLVVDTGVTDAKSAAVYKYNEKGTCNGMYVWFLEFDGSGYVATYESELDDLLTNHGFSIRITGESGMRYKIGISPETRSKLIDTGVDGYRLKEYGSIVTNKKNLATYPFVFKGEKTKSSLSYGYDQDGNFVDLIYETGNEGRYRYTSVLTGLPVTTYKNEYAFRGYLILENNGKEVILYGAPAARSIYSIAEVLLSMNTYEEGSNADLFIRKLISDADALEQ